MPATKEAARAAERRRNVKAVRKLLGDRWDRRLDNHLFTPDEQIASLLVMARETAALPDAELRERTMTALSVAVPYEGSGGIPTEVDAQLDACITELDRRDRLVHTELCPAYGETWSAILLAYQLSKNPNYQSLFEDRPCNCRARKRRASSDAA